SPPGHQRRSRVGRLAWPGFSLIPLWAETWNFLSCTWLVYLARFDFNFARRHPAPIKTPAALCWSRPNPHFLNPATAILVPSIRVEKRNISRHQSGELVGGPYTALICCALPSTRP